MPKHPDGLNVYPAEGGYAVRFKRGDGRRLTVKLPVNDEARATRETVELLTEAIYLLRSRRNDAGQI